MYENLLFPGVIRENWQMMVWERIAMTGVLARLRPLAAIEVGVYYGGSLSLTSQFAGRVVAIDIDPDVPHRFRKPDNVDLWIGASTVLIPKALAHFEQCELPVGFVLIDADHSAAGVKRDVELVLQYQPRAPMVVLIHDSGNPDCRHGILSADWSANPHVHAVECDFVPGQIIEHSVRDGRGEVWGGLALAYLDPTPRNGPLSIRQGAATSIRCIQCCAGDLSIVA